MWMDQLCGIGPTERHSNNCAFNSSGVARQKVNQDTQDVEIENHCKEGNIIRNCCFNELLCSGIK